MTLIAGAYDGADCVLVSDTVWSSPRKPLVPPNLPMGIGRPIVPSTPAEPRFHIHGTTRKVTLVSPTLAVAWAGQAVVGANIAKELIEVVGGKRYVPTAEVGNAIKSMAGELSPQEFAELGIMALNVEQKSPGRFSSYIWSGGCEKIDYLGNEIMLTGSGMGHFTAELFTAMDFVNPIDNQQMGFKQALFSSLHLIQNKQLDIGDAFEHLYGGWFEIIFPSYSNGEVHLHQLSNVAVIDMVPTEDARDAEISIFAYYLQTYIDDVLVILRSEKSNTGFGMTDVHLINPCIAPRRVIEDKVMNIDLKSDVTVFYLTVPYKGEMKKIVIPVFSNERTYLTWTAKRISLTVDDEIRGAVEGVLRMVQST